MNTTQVSKYLIKGEMQGEKVMNNLREFLHRLTISYKFWRAFPCAFFFQVTLLFITCNLFHISTFRPLVFEPMLPTVI